GGEVDQRSDIFSLGSLLYEMLAGHPPFKGEHTAAVIYSITNEEPEPLSRLYQRVPQAMERVISKALEKRPGDRYQTAAAFAEDLKRIQAGMAPVAGGHKRRALNFVLPTSAVFLAVVLFFIFRPFSFQIKSEGPVAGAGNSLAIMYFENIVDKEDPKRLGAIVTNLLITDLSESEYLQVVSSQRLYDILKLQGREEAKVVDRDTATEVAKHAGAKWMLLGSILQEEPNLIMTSNLVDVETGKVVASQRITGETGEEIFALVDRLTEEIKDDLALPAAAQTEKNMPVAQVTTHSTEAYRYYLMGMEDMYKYYGLEARQAFDKALEYDSTFAMVYLRKSDPLVSQSRSESRAAIAKAVEYSDRVSEKEKHYIESMNALFSGDTDGAIAELESIIKEYPQEKEAYRALGNIYRNHELDPEKAIACYRKIIELDPLDKFAYNVLAYSYQAVGDIDNYIWAIYQYMALAPDEANPYDSRADLYAYTGNLDKAIESYNDALERKADFYPSIGKLGNMQLFKGDFEAASAYYRRLVTCDDPSMRAWGRMLMVLVPLFQGKLDPAIETAEAGISADRAENFMGDAYFWKGVTIASILAAKGRYDRAIPVAEKWIGEYRAANPDDPVSGSEILIRFAARSGDIEKAETLLSKLKTDIENTDKTRMRAYWRAAAEIEMAKENYDAAAELFKKGSIAYGSFYPEYFVALCHLKAGRAIEAVNEFDHLLRSYSEDRAQSPLESVRAYYYLGVAHEESGHGEKAVEWYEKFLDYWGGADPALTEVQDARQRLAVLTQAG
ncbi:MAG: tetratricopeptide repeat protein, partial [bacterium]